MLHVFYWEMNFVDYRRITGTVPMIRNDKHKKL